MKVLDTSAIIRSDMDFSKGGYIITPGVLSEIQSEDVLDVVGLSIGKKHIKVCVPSEKHLQRTHKSAVETGDFEVLSETDFEVLAAASEFNAEIVSDDYAVQNVAKHMDIPFERTAHPGIQKEIAWESVCVGCGKKFPEGKTQACPVCGHKIRRKPKKQ